MAMFEHDRQTYKVAEAITVSEASERDDRISEGQHDESGAQLKGRLTTTWDIMYAVAKKYYHSTGALDPPSRLITEDGYALGAWVHYLRSQCKKNSQFLTDEQYKMLDAIGMRWGNKYDLQWDDAYSELCEFYRINNSIDVPVVYKTKNGLLLGRWIRRQIESYAKGQLRPDRIERLEQLGIVWNPVDAWEEKFQLAKAYSEAHDGIDMMPSDYTVSGIPLYQWLNEQKLIGEGKCKRRLTAKQREKLASIGLVFHTAANDLVSRKESESTPQ